MPAGKTIAVIGALDTKGVEVAYIRHAIEARGHRVLVIDVGVLGEPATKPDIARRDVAAAAGTDLGELVAAADRGRAVATMAEGARSVVISLYRDKRIDGVLGLGGGAGTSVATAAMRALPIGVPKVMVSTLAGGDVRSFVGVKDITMMPTIVDVSGLNRISRGVFTRAAAAVCGMVDAEAPPADDKPLLTASMFGNTTIAVEAAKAILEARGYEVLVFHATGTGGETMESLIETGDVAGVLDMTTTEWADQLLGGVMAAGPTRLDAAPKTGTPAVVAPGCLDMVNFWKPESVPAKYKNRRLYAHNPNVTLVRTTPEDNAELGRILAEKVNASVGPVAVYLPLKGVSVISAEGGPFHWPEADQALFGAIRSHVRPEIPVYELDVTINDPAFSRAMAEGLLALLP